MAHAFRARVVASHRRTWGAFGASTGLGLDVRYTPAGGGASADVRAMRVVKDVLPDDPFAARVLQTARAFDLLADDVGARPAKGATIATLDAAGAVVETFTLFEAAVSEDSLNVVWRCRTGDGV